MSREPRMYDLTSTLLAKDVSMHTMKEEGRMVKYLRVHIKSPKEQRLSNGITVELFETGSEVCPVTAFLKWQQDSKLSKGKAGQFGKNKPLIRLEEGLNYTGKNLNDDLKKLLSPYMDYDHQKILSHSFR